MRDGRLGTNASLAAMRCPRLLVGLVVLLGLLYTLFPAHWHTLCCLAGEHYDLAHRQWRDPHGGGRRRRRRRCPPTHPPQPEETPPTQTPEEVVPADHDAAADVLEYTPTVVGTGRRTPRVRILHPQSREALDRVLQEGRHNPDIRRQTVVTSSAQYDGVTPDTPLVIHTYL